MATAFEVQLAKLQAAEDIRRLKATYAQLCDTGYDPKRIVPLFTEGASWDGGQQFGTYIGKDQIHAFFAAARHRITWALHYMVAPVIEVADDLVTATGTWYLWQPCTMINVDSSKEEAIWLAGRYFDQYRQEEGVWRFSEVRLVIEMISPIDEGWVQRRFRNQSRD